MEETAKGWAVLLSIRAVHAANIYAGTKTVELRKSVPRHRCRENSAKYPFRVYLYESKSAGGLVVDFFAGSGSTGVAAIRAGRSFILIDNDEPHRAEGAAWIEKERQKALCI